MLIATGAEYGRITAEGREKFEGRGVYYAATPVEAASCKTAEVIVVGGGNSAGQAAVYLSQNARRVYHLIRGDDLYKNMSSYLARRIEHTENIVLLKNTEIIRMEGKDHLQKVELRNNKTGETRTIDTDGVFTFIGVTPRTDWLSPRVMCDTKGFIKTGLSDHGRLQLASQAAALFAGDMPPGRLRGGGCPPRFNQARGLGSG